VQQGDSCHEALGIASDFLRLPRKSAISGLGGQSECVQLHVGAKTFMKEVSDCHLALYSKCERLVVPGCWKRWVVQVDVLFDVSNCSFHEESALDISFNHVIHDS
jgi:hypothetical protein